MNSWGVFGVLQVKTNLKIQEKLGLFRPHPPTPYPILFFFETFGNMKTTHKKNKKNTTFPQKNYNPSWGLCHSPTSEFFSDFFIFFNLTKPVKAGENSKPALRTYMDITLSCEYVISYY